MVGQVHEAVSTWWEVPLSMAGDCTKTIFKVPSDPNHSMIP